MVKKIILFVTLLPLLGIGQVKYKGKELYYKGQKAIYNSLDTTPNDQPLATLSVSPGNGLENIGTTTFTITLNEFNNTGSPITVGYSVSGSATSGSDYTVLSGSVDIADGSSTGQITATITDDGIDESNESLTLTLSNGNGYIVSDPSIATFTILDDDGSAAGAPSITNTEAIPTENSIVVSVSANEKVDVQIEYGPTNSYGTTVPFSSDLREINNIKIEGLDDNTLYHYQVTVRDAENNQTVGTDNTVTTLTETVVGTCTPGSVNSATTLTDLTGATAGSTWQINAVIDATNASLAANLILTSGTGHITGTSIDLSNACVVNDFNQVFSNSVTFDSKYDNSYLSFEMFGANGSDALADDDEIDRTIICSNNIIGQNGETYIKNQESDYNNVGGNLNWDLNGSTVRTTDASALSHSSANDQGNRFLFQFRNIAVKIKNGEFDGQDLASRALYFRDVQSYDVQNLNVHNYYAPPLAAVRGYAFRIAVVNNFTGGQILNTTMANIGAASDGNFNNVPFGFSKGIYTTVGTENAAVHTYKGNTFSNIYGDDAEGFSNTHSYLYDTVYQHATTGQEWVVENNNFIGCQRRALKLNLSNVEVHDNYMESASNNGDGFQASQVQTFSFHAGQNIQDVNITNNVIRIVGDSRNAGFGINDATNCLIENNVFDSSYTDLKRTVFFGVTSTQNGLYDGDLDNTVIFRNNTMTNFIIGFNGVYQAVNGGFVFEDNTLNIDVDRYLNAWWAAIKMQSTSGDSEPYTIKNLSININQTDSAGGIFRGAFLSNGASPMNVTLDNVDINYTGTVLPSSPFARIGTPGFDADFDSTNTIINCDITGAIGTGSIDVTGTIKNVTITNSFGDGTSAITVQ